MMRKIMTTLLQLVFTLLEIGDQAVISGDRTFVRTGPLKVILRRSLCF